MTMMLSVAVPSCSRAAAARRLVATALGSSSSSCSSPPIIMSAPHALAPPPAIATAGGAPPPARDTVRSTDGLTSLLPRYYSTSRPILDKKSGGGGGNGNNGDGGGDDDDDDDDDEEPTGDIQKINSDLSDAEIEKILDEELALLEAEAEARKGRKDWKPGQRKRPLQMSYRLEDFEAEYSDEPTWTLLDKRCGALGIKLGMMPVWDDWGERHPCTVLHLDSNIVLRNKTVDGPDGYDAVVLGAGERKKKNVNRALLATYEKFGVADQPPYVVREFRVSTADAMPEPGTRIHARHFIPGQNIDVAGISKGKGFQGAMKRHNFAGMPATHGNSKSHRALGSTGQCQDPGKVFKGKKMAGHMGTDRVTVQNLRIVKVDRGRNLLYVKGAIPGNRGEFVEIRDAVKKPLFGTDKVEGGVEGSKFPPLPTFPYEAGIDGCGEAGHEAVMPLAQKDPFAPDEDAMAAA